MRETETRAERLALADQVDVANGIIRHELLENTPEQREQPARVVPPMSEQRKRRLTRRWAAACPSRAEHVARFVDRDTVQLCACQCGLVPRKAGQ